MPGVGWQSTETLVTAAVGRTESQAARSAEATSTIEGCMRSSPATASEVSSRSSTSRDCAWALRSITSAAWLRRSSGTWLRRSIVDQPRMAFERRAELVGEVREQVVLDAVRLFGGGQEPFALRLVLLALGDVADVRDEEDLVVQLDADEAQLDRELGAVVAKTDGLEPSVQQRSLVCRRALEDLVDGVAAVRGDDQVRHAQAEDVGAAAAEHRRGAHG